MCFESVLGTFSHGRESAADILLRLFIILRSGP